ncbi:MAG: glycosyltransferase [Prevotellaceae bacterium]|nr:glycosyltransferase [Prevotellaceae bacterium]
MNIAVLHSGNAGFFPRYYCALVSAAQTEGNEIALFSPNSGRNRRNRLPCQITWGTRLNWFVHSRLYKLTGMEDVFSFWETMALLFKLEKYVPDVIHLNLVNDKIINMPLFTYYVNKRNIPVVWTMHDCRAFTGGCPYFDEIGCDRWKTGCGQCKQSKTWIDGTHIVWKIRRRWHAGIKNLTIVTPSEWLASFVRESFLGKHPIKVIYNGVDTTSFSKPSNLDVRSKYNIANNKKIVLGCAINWEARKGLHFFETLADMLPSDYQIVLVGGIDAIRQGRLKKKGVICTGRTSTLDEMVAWYQRASVFCNPTLADNFPTTNIESLAAGTPIVTFRTGGSPETVDDKTGIVIEQGNIQALSEAVQTICEHRDRYTSDACYTRSQMFSDVNYKEYIKLFYSVKIFFDE